MGSARRVGTASAGLGKTRDRARLGADSGPVPPTRSELESSNKKKTGLS